MQTWVVEIGLAVLAGLVVYQVMDWSADESPCGPSCCEIPAPTVQEQAIAIPKIQLPGGLGINPWEGS